ncbi:uncharacterized protein APUU_60816S [Aspergillus puulaauensis]|uniref:TauD/TfdA-like domain-containing protein n=1 Tax=Aspergillus puulaauensis TaxID=1220207 RepID=A0A7R7XVM3_9EURO|nr:uncharacterized protein APUU_60816S [Aspergillus puulaauensis]BCS27768.1 hypothetical protein APUU_60816S [Aspergillus puulaauensis]
MHVRVQHAYTTRKVEVDTPSDSVKITWNNDLAGYGEDHVTTLKLTSLQDMTQSGRTPGSHKDTFPPHELWTEKALNLPDYDYDRYMKDDRFLYQLVNQLRTDGLAFVTNVPGLEESLATIATRIGPVKDTFYGYTWDVRTVPEAINAAYTSHDLGFHTDLLYFHQPPHVQLLHCIQSASSGGASVFADAYKAAVDLFYTDMEAFDTLASVPVNYHYNHPDSNVYHTTKPVIDLCPLQIGSSVYTRFQDFANAMELYRGGQGDKYWKTKLLVDCLQKINWCPPFLAPFSNHDQLAIELEAGPSTQSQSPVSALNNKVEKWHQAACKFNALLQRPEYLYERKMNPGECVLFDNTRTLHSRRAFDMQDVGKPRWLRGTYVDKDPYLSKLRVLQNRFG